MYIAMIRRALRRLRARWRLHRIEWNAMHRPYQPPKGYESYYELDELFPGLKGLKPIKDFAHFRRIFRGAVQLYMAQYTKKTPQILKDYMQRQAREKDRTDREHMEQDKVLEEQASAIGEDVADLFVRKTEDGIPRAEEVITKRYGIFKQSLSGLLEGFKQGVAGNRDIAGNVLFHEDSARLDNLPYIYFADTEEEAASQ